MLILGLKRLMLNLSGVVIWLTWQRLGVYMSIWWSYMRSTVTLWDSGGERSMLSVWHQLTTGKKYSQSSTNLVRLINILVHIL